MTKPKPRHYSGDNSRKFWDRVNALKNEKTRHVIYGLGCDLQNLEELVLRELEIAEKANRKKKP